MSQNKDAIQVREAEVLAPQSMTIEGVLMRAVESNASIETLEKLMSMRRELRDEAAKEAFHTALAAFQSECPVIPRKRIVRNKPEKGGGIRYHFTALEDIDKVVKPILSKNGTSYTITTSVTKPTEKGETPYLQAICVLRHKDGHQEETPFDAPVDLDAFMTSQQKYAAAASFCERYAIKHALGLTFAGEDNDGNGLTTPADARKAQDRKPVNQPQAKKSAPTGERPTIQPAANTDEAIEASTIKVLRKKMDDLSTIDFEKRFGFAEIERIKKSDINTVMNWIMDPANA